MSKEVENLRDRLELTQEELAQCFGLTGRSTVSRWQTGWRQVPEPLRRLFCLLNDMPKKDALALLKKLKSYDNPMRRP